MLKRYCKHIGWAESFLLQFQQNKQTRKFYEQIIPEYQARQGIAQRLHHLEYVPFLSPPTQQDSREQKSWQ